MSIVQSKPLEAPHADTRLASLDLRVALCSMLFICGLYIDGWAHFHGRVDESFFTPYHAILYGSFGITAAVILFEIGSRWRLSRDLKDAIPAFYFMSLVGVMLFAVGGLGDMVWHTLFGIEEDVEALISPSHLVLALGGVLITIAPLRAAWFRPNSTLTLRQSLPITLTITAMLSLFTFFTAYIHPLNEVVASGEFRRWSRLTQSNAQIVGMGSIMIQAAFTMGILLIISERWRWSLPTGSVTFFLGVNALLMSVLRDQYGLALAYIAAGLLADLLIAFGKPEQHRSVMRLIAFSLPFSTTLFYLLLLMQRGNFEWSVPMWTGACVIAGIVGYLMSLLISPPPFPQPQNA